MSADSLFARETDSILQCASVTYRDGIKSRPPKTAIRSRGLNAMSGFPVCANILRRSNSSMLRVKHKVCWN